MVDKIPNDNHRYLSWADGVAFAAISSHRYMKNTVPLMAYQASSAQINTDVLNPQQCQQMYVGRVGDRPYHTEKFRFAPYIIFLHLHLQRHLKNSRGLVLHLMLIW